MADGHDKIQLYTYRTANGRKVSIMLEECGLPYDVHVVDITKGEQHSPAFRRVNPNARIPAIVDPDGPGGKPARVFESGAILWHLGEKCGRFLGGDAGSRLEAMQWLMFQMGGVGPMFGQDFHFLHQAPADTHKEALAYGRARYGAEATRLCKVLDYRLREYEFLAKSYTVADIAVFPWVALHQWLKIDLEEYVGLKRWYERLKARPAVQRGMDVPSRATMG
jgi:GSH-dependent disulfide-bond oxidoreductase